MQAATPLRKGWTTGACATAAARAAFAALIDGAFPDPVTIVLPRGERVAFSLAATELRPGCARATVIKDAGDDPDVTHGAAIVVTVTPGPSGGGIVFRAGEGVGTVTHPGLAIPPGEPAINPIPRQMILANLSEVAPHPDAVVEIAIPGGEQLAERTLNGRLGIVGGLSILGTTGIVVPYSCAAWIDSIHRGIDVARATGLGHVAGATGNTSEIAVQRLHGLPDSALIEMGDFVGGMLKYLRTHPVARVTVAGGVAKMSKLAQGFLDLHSRRGEVDLSVLARETPPEIAARIASANTVAEAFAIADAAGLRLGDTVADGAWNVAAAALRPARVELETVLFDRTGALVGRHGFAPV